MKKFVFAAIAAMVMVSVSNVFASYKWVLRRFAVYVRTGGHSGGMAAGRVNPIAGMYVRSKRA